MTSWMKERDRLMAQTLEFVQGVTGARPGAIARSDAMPPALPVAPPAANAIVLQPPAELQTLAGDLNDLIQTVDKVEQAEDVAASAAAILSTSSRPPMAIRASSASPSIEAAASIDAAAARPAAPPQRQIPLTAGSEREDILKRVAAFQARQSQLSRERESYYEDMHAKIQQRLGGGGDGKVLP